MSRIDMSAQDLRPLIQGKYVHVQVMSSCVTFDVDGWADADSEGLVLWAIPDAEDLDCGDPVFSLDYECAIWREHGTVYFGDESNWFAYLDLIEPGVYDDETPCLYYVPVVPAESNRPR